MAMSPHDKSLVAVGYRSGVLCLVDVAQGTTRHRLAGHDQEVQCVAWKATIDASVQHPDRGDDEENATEVGFLGREVWLASSSRDKTIKVWKVPLNETEEAALDQVLRLPTGKQGMSFTQTKQLWLPVAWSLDDSCKASDIQCLWSGSFDGSLLRWEFNCANMECDGRKGKRRQCKPLVVKGGHSRMLFSIVMVPSRGPPHPEDDPVSMLTVSLDRELRLWKETPSAKSSVAAVCLQKIAGLGGHAYSVSFNATSKVIAAGIGDQTIRLWNLGTETEPVSTDYQCELLWKGLQSKVTCVRWHPFQHSLLAYGMEDGRFGVYDTQTNKYKHFRTCHDHEVQQLQWIVLQPKKRAVNGENSFLESIKQLEAAQAQGQMLEDALVDQEGLAGKNRDADARVVLWSCDAGGHLLESHADALDQKSREVFSDCVIFEWEGQHEFLATGRSNGIVEVMSRDESTCDSTKAIYRFHEHLDSVTCLAWSRGVKTRMLASGGQDGKIFVYSCGAELAAEFNEAVSPSSTEAATEGVVFGCIVHSNKITALKWCLDVSQSFLASSSADGTVQVWNSVSWQRVACFNHHIGRVLSLEWISTYTLVTGGEDQTLRLWDYRKQQKDPSPKTKKHGKVKQPQEIVAAPISENHADAETQKGEVIADDALQNSSTDTCNAKPCAKTTKKNVTIFHPKGKLTPAEIASACSNMAGAIQDTSNNMDGLATVKPVDCFLAHNDRASVRSFLAGEVKRYWDEREWESVANTLLLQGNVIEALRIVAKEGALSPTWLSYAPMAGMDVWREMTNLYAHQLEAQGDMTTAGLLPTDVSGEAALALLSIGSVEANTKAIHTLIDIGDMVSVGAAVGILLGTVETQEKLICQLGANLEKDSSELSFPASFFVSIAAHALSMGHFDVAERAGQLLQSRLVVSSSPVVHRLTWCLLGIIRTIDEHQLGCVELAKFSDGVVNNQLESQLQSDAPASVREFFEFLVGFHNDEGGGIGDGLYTRLVAGMHEGQPSIEQLVGRAYQFWFQILNICKRSGYWFNTDIQEAQDKLVEANCFSEIENAVATKGTHTAASFLVQIAQRLLRFVIDVMSTSFVGALEHLREAFLLLAQSSVIDTPSPVAEEPSKSRSIDLPQSVMTLLRPISFASLKKLPQCGELAYEKLDTIVLWSSVLLSQCGIVLGISVAIAENSSGSQSHEVLLEPVLKLLRASFVDDAETTPLNLGLRDAGNQSQIQTLLNAVLAAVHHLPDKPAELLEHIDGSAEQNEEKQQSRKQTLINDANDLKSRLTWCEDGIKQEF
ncbi:unnamed protein product [Phytophthora lilii]|uniref:Unnamed protein product n=1 Tax=Phytophthora lilii TaxID=2077276 RepID=A0A9W6UB50_9STRA|nr:unnamed protein product [Phytophthora lilii]